MKNEVFNFGNHEVRVVVAENNEPMFVAKDVCEVLEYSSASDALRILDDDEKLIRKLCVAGQNRNVNVITESGLYSLVLRSNKPEAKAFKKWITSEVLPSIRKNGMYATAPTIENMIDDPDFAIGLLNKLKQEREEKERLMQQNQLQDEQLKIAAPKVLYVDEVLQSKSTYTTNQIAKELGMSAIGLNNELKSLGIQYKQSNTWLLYAKYQDKGYTKTKTHTFTDSHGNTQTAMNTVWTEKGRLFIHDNINFKKAM
ncbi:phage antirepressor KilAC domain-containing protein [Flavobacterium sp. UMI-01]|uniref:phage antirepressor n=1 Tax=Flavobacterium sp. UMI-01 TaxID=1441053 RepID=UPI002085BF57|nr:phage antirepressor KilAC domain-containing protein [Flavobacterium sp. UMI-01]GIZ08359.1 phage antirepressor KilAC domain-containing protein [Flavobacterium sp. UMI-01]